MILKRYRKTLAVLGFVQVCVSSFLLIQVYTSRNPNSISSLFLESINVPNWQRRLRKSGIQSGPFFLTAVVRVRLYKEDKAKWTVAEFKQWMHYQFWAGVEHIYVCNHFINESERIEKPLEKYIELGLITILAWNEPIALPGSKTYIEDNADNQNACYQHILKLYRNQSTWQYNFDMDENPYCLDDQEEGFFCK